MCGKHLGSPKWLYTVQGVLTLVHAREVFADAPNGNG